MFHVELAPLGGILGPLKSDLGVFWAKIPLYPYNVKFSNSIFSKSANLPILSFWILNVHIINCQFQKRSTVKHFLSLSPCSCHLWELSASKPNNAPDYTDQNDQHFGEWKAKFIDTCVQFMCHWVNVRDNAGVNQEKARRGKKQVIEDLFQRDLFHPGKEKNWKNSILLDSQALGWFRSSNKGNPTDEEMARIFKQVFKN